MAEVITLPLTQLEAMVSKPSPGSQNAAGSFSRQVPGCFDAKFLGRQVIKQRGVVTDRGEVDQLRFRAPAFTHQKHQIWGATALILDQLAQVLHSFR